MNRPLLYIGALVILAMCLVPPWTVEDYDRLGRDTDAAITVRGFPDTATRAEHTSTRSAYRPLWAEREWEGPFGHHEFSGQIDVKRLLLQILGAVLVTGLLSATLGRRP